MHSLRFESCTLNYHQDLDGPVYVRANSSQMEVIVVGSVLRSGAASKDEFVELIGPLKTDDNDGFAVTAGPRHDRLAPGSWPKGTVRVKTRDVQEALIIDLGSRIVEAGERAMDLGEGSFEVADTAMRKALRELNLLYAANVLVPRLEQFGVGGVEEDKSDGTTAGGILGDVRNCLVRLGVDEDNELLAGLREDMVRAVDGESLAMPTSQRVAFARDRLPGVLAGVREES